MGKMDESESKEVAVAKTGVGAAVSRLEYQLLTSGRGRYTDDVSFPGLVYGYVVRSPYVHARIYRC